MSFVRRGLTGVLDTVSQPFEWLFNTRNAVIQVFFFILYAGGLAVFLLKTLRYCPSQELPIEHKYIAFLLIFWNVFNYCMTAWSDPGTVTAENHAEYMAKYEFDGVLFTRGYKCRTCKRDKPARSKHCGLCNACISRADHHCYWVNNCVGEKNHHYFIIWLLTMTAICVYGSWFLWQAIQAHIRIHGLADTRYVVNGKVVPANARILFTYMVATETMMISLFLILFLFAFVVAVFSIVHIYEVAHNSTLNEAAKLDGLGADGIKNPYDEGCCRNLMTVFFNLPPASRRKQRPKTRRKKRKAKAS